MITFIKDLSSTIFKYGEDMIDTSLKCSVNIQYQKGLVMSGISHQSSDGFTGLEAAIVLIAFVVVASVFAYVILGAGFFTTQKAQETVYKSVEQASTNVQIVGNVYGIQSEGSSGINEMRFSLKLTPDHQLSTFPGCRSSTLPRQQILQPFLMDL